MAMATERIGIGAASGLSATELRGSKPSAEAEQRRSEPAQAQAQQQSGTTVTISPRAQQLAAQDGQESSKADEQAASEQSAQRSAELRRSYNLGA
jgi:hypothetical protein